MDVVIAKFLHQRWNLCGAGRVPVGLLLGEITLAHAGAGLYEVCLRLRRQARQFRRSQIISYERVYGSEGSADSTAWTCSRFSATDLSRAEACAALGLPSHASVPIVANAA